MAAITYSMPDRAELNTCLKGERGVSTLALLSGRGRASFDPQSVKMGLTASCPMPIRHQVIAQYNYRANEYNRAEQQDPFTNDSIRVTNLMAGTIGMALSLTYRVVRTVLRTVFLPITVTYAYHQQCRYAIDGWALEDLKRIAWEWVDLGAILASAFIGIINTFHPNAIKLDSLKEYYVQRTNQATSRNQEFAGAKRDYLDRRARVAQAQGV
ncbi:MAG: hypothetical protein S4CHLAM2_13950 [Chlamydiales bacterium]|nr:hypothetical protein [Chlamydiales bacterium]